jgi:thymidine kinase
LAKLHFYYSAMNAGKSTTLLQSSHNYNERGMETLLFLPSFDTRSGVGKIASRIGLTAEAAIFDAQFDFVAFVREAKSSNSKVSCILVDEAHFLTKSQVRQLCYVADFLDLPVLAYGLRSDFQGEPFPGSLYLLSWADVLIELKTICTSGKKATMNMRIDAQGQPVLRGAQVEIGGNERYISVARKQFALVHGWDKICVQKDPVCE